VLVVWAEQFYYSMLMKKRKKPKTTRVSEPEEQRSLCAGSIKTPAKVDHEGCGNLKGHNLIAALIAEKKIERER
jgi:hypothetical protein